MVDQIRLRTLLKEDELYRAWFQKPPTVTVVHHQPPWRVFIQMEQGGRWARGDIRGYAKAYNEVRSRLRDAWDMTIHCKPQAFKPPVIKVAGKRYYMPMPSGHDWCVYCRRPTVFRYFTKHHNMKLYAVGGDPWKRCTICGARQEPMKRYPSPLVWPPAAQ